MKLKDVIDISYIEYNPDATDDDGSCSILSSRVVPMKKLAIIVLLQQKMTARVHIHQKTT